MVTESPSELRFASRIGVRTPVVIYEIRLDGTVARARSWTDDLSTSGVKLITENRLRDNPLYIRIMLPELKDRVIACEKIREDDGILHPMGSSRVDVRRWSYGLRFVGVADSTTQAAIELADEAALSRKTVASPK